MTMRLANEELVVAGTVSRTLRFFFFFSSRRRHTRLQGDWSSDVCSSDLKPGDEYFSGAGGLTGSTQDYLAFAQMLLNGGQLNGTRLLSRKTVELMTSEIGRASCRERV